DQATQQNAALVEEMAAAASSLSTQATQLVQAVAVFKLAGHTGTAMPQTHQAQPPKTPASMPFSPHVRLRPTPPTKTPTATALAARSDENGWESF
ncbi:MAG: methyl-accepting chemotaxis protein, partial [Proteobacteria bacterium]|nr:methyl-accepting chemotaxis protein [Pseudomonadota bacterium]